MSKEGMHITVHVEGVPEICAQLVHARTQIEELSTEVEDLRTRNANLVEETIRQRKEMDRLSEEVVAIRFDNQCWRDRLHYSEEQVERLKGEVRRREIALTSLTPLGSEWCNAPEKCAEFSRNEREKANDRWHEWVRRLVAEWPEQRRD